MSQYNYDEEGHFFPFVLLTFLIIILIPITFPLFYSGHKDDLNTSCYCEACKEQDRIIRECRKRTLKNPRIPKKIILIFAGWCLVAYILYQISTIKVNHKIWDPYEILGIPMTSTEKEIKKRYKKLSLKFHPDKVRLNKTQTRESAESLYVEITKAYKALTDEDIRRNYIEYGHPDGKQSFSIGIALPKWIVESKNNYYVLGAYAIAFGFALPYYVGIQEIMIPGKAELLISQSQEYKFLTGFEDELINIEKKILLKDSKYQLHNQHDLSYRKAYLLLYAHFHQQISLLQLALELQSGLLSICLIYGFLQPVVYIMELSQTIVQAIPFSGSPLLQLPYISKKVAKEIVEKIGHPVTVEQFLKIPENKRRDLLSSYTDKEYSLIMNIASRIPIISIFDSSFKGDSASEIANSEIEDETDDDETGFFLKRKKKDEEASIVPYAHKHKPKWWVFVVDIKHDRVVIPPIAIKNIGRRVKTFRVFFQAPSQTGVYTFQIQVKSDTYIGTDLKKNVEFKVEKDASTDMNNTYKKDFLRNRVKNTISGDHSIAKNMTKELAKEDDVYTSDDSSLDDYEANNEYDEHATDTTSDSDIAD
ncbi:hypothetical protein PCANB_000839 [Pneumocystis canis]|nr:hypothetical protein PCANB_000839 [Pneumocystis canis]